MDAKQIVERNKQSNEESKKQEEEMIARIKPSNLGDWANIINIMKDINLKRNISQLTPDQKSGEVKMLNGALEDIDIKITELEVKINQDFPPTQTQPQRIFPFFRWSSEKERQKIEKEKSDMQNEYGQLKLLKRDIQEQLFYYNTGGTGGTRKLRKKRIKRTRVR